MFFNISCRIFTLKGDRLKLLTDCNFNGARSLDEKAFIKYLDDMKIDERALLKGKTGTFFVTKRVINKSRLLSSRLALLFLSKVLGETCSRLLFLLNKIRL